MSAAPAAQRPADTSTRKTVQEQLAQHRSIRRFQSREVDASVISDVVETALQGTSSYGNLNCATVIATRAQERLAILRQLHFNQPTATSAPLLLTVCADVSRLRAWLALHGAPDNFDNFHGFMVAAIDAALLAQSVALGLEAAGLGICFMGTTLDRCAEICAFLGLPAGCVPVTTLAVGHADETPEARDRLPLAAHLHEENYHVAVPEELLRLYAGRDRLGWTRVVEHAVPDELRRAENIVSFAHYCTSSLRYPRAESLATSASLIALLQRQQFGTTSMAGTDVAAMPPV